MKLSTPKLRTTTLHVRMTSDTVAGLDRLVEAVRKDNPESAGSISRSWLVTQLLGMGMEQLEKSLARMAKAEGRT